MTAPLQPAEVAAIRERTDALPPDWFTQGEPNGHRINAKGHGAIAVASPSFMGRTQRLNIAAFIASCRSDVPRLCDTITAKDVRIAELEREDAKKAATIAAMEIYADVPRVSHALVYQNARIAALESELARLTAEHAGCKVDVFNADCTLTEVGKAIMAEQVRAGESAVK